MMATVKTLYSASFTTNNYSCLQALNWATHEESRSTHHTIPPLIILKKKALL